MRPTITVSYPSMEATPRLPHIGELQRLAAISSTLANTLPRGTASTDEPDPRDGEALTAALTELIDALAGAADAGAEDLIFEHAELGPRARRLMRARAQLRARGRRLLTRLRTAQRAGGRAPLREIGRFAGLVARHAAAERAMWITAEFLDLGGGG